MNNEILAGKSALLTDLFQLDKSHNEQEELIIDEILDSRNDFIDSKAAYIEAELLLMKERELKSLAIGMIGAGVKYMKDYKLVISNPENIIYERAIALFMIELEDILRNLPKELFSTPTDYTFVRTDLLNCIQLLYSFDNNKVQIDKLSANFKALKNVFPARFFGDTIQPS